MAKQRNYSKEYEKRKQRELDRYNKLIAKGVPHHEAQQAKKSEASTKKAIKRQNQRIRRATYKFELMQAGYSEKEATQLARGSRKKVDEAIMQRNLFYKGKRSKYLIFGVKDVTENDDNIDYINEVQRIGRRMTKQELHASLLDALNNPDMNMVGTIGKGYIYITASESENNDIITHMRRSGITLLYRGQGTNLKSLQVSLNIAMSLFYYLDERDKFIQDVISALRTLDNEDAHRNADILEKELIF